MLTDKADADASLVDSTSSAAVFGAGEVGGAIGSVQSDGDGSSNITISGNTTTESTVNKSGDPDDYFYYSGGLIGYLDIENSSIDVLISDNTVSAPQLLDNNNYQVGGIIGYGEIYDDSNLTISANQIDQNIAGRSYVGGVIGELEVYDNSTVNLTDQDYSGDVTAYDQAGGLVGQVYSESCNGGTTVTFERTSYSGTISAYSDVGGISGGFDYDCGDERYQIIDSSTSGSILTDGGYYAGGLVGYAYYTDVSDSSSTMDVDSTEYVGGLFGSLEYDSSINNSYATGTLGVEGNTEYAGGLIGYAYGDDIDEAPLRINESYYSGTISGNDTIGGLVGDADYAIIIQRSYAELTTDDPSAYEVGGLIGYSGEENYVNDSYAEVNIMGNSDLGGLVGRGRVSLTDSYANGLIDSDGTTIGGAVGDLYDYSEVNNVFASVDITSTEPLTVGGLIGGMGGDASVVNSFVDGTVSSQGCMVVFGGGTPTYECEVNNTPNAFKGNSETAPMGGIWDFDSVWGVRTADFPCLQWAAESCIGAESDETSATLASAEDGSLITFQQSGCTTINDASTVKESGFHATDPAYSYPVGFVDFNVSGCQVGGQATFTITFTGNFDPAKVTIRKYNSVTHAYSTLTNANSGLVVTKITLSGKPAIQAVYHITDGGEFDQDGVNGQIFDPIGVGVLTVAAPNTGFSR